MKGCIDCKHKESSYEKERQCKKGHTALLNKWFADNGSRTRDMGFINNHSCFEPHDINVLLDNAIQATGEVIKKLKGSIQHDK